MQQGKPRTVHHACMQVGGCGRGGGMHAWWGMACASRRRRRPPRAARRAPHLAPDDARLPPPREAVCTHARTQGRAGQQHAFAIAHMLVMGTLKPVPRPHPHSDSETRQLASSTHTHTRRCSCMHTAAFSCAGARVINICVSMNQPGRQAIPQLPLQATQQLM